MPEIKAVVKIQAPGGRATPAPPVGPVLGQHGVNIQDFVTRFNDLTKNMVGDTIPVEVTIYEDRTISLKLKTPPASQLLLKAAKVTKGSSIPQTIKVGSVTRQHVREIAERKKADLSARDIDQAMKIIAGTARSIGITIE